MAEHKLKRITIEGFKSIRMLKDFELRPINVLIGANGSGKSNFLSVFPFLRAAIRNATEEYVKLNGTPDSFFFLGPKVTKRIFIEVDYDPPGGFQGEFKMTADNILIKASHIATGAGKLDRTGQIDRSGLLESLMPGTTYHFHDTSPLSLLKRDQNVRHDRVLESDASNIAAFLHGLRERDEAAYMRIVSTVRLVAPFIDDFLLESRRMGEDEMVRLEWLQRGSDYPFQPYQLSDGTLRFICLATALMQSDPPPIVIIDEPELGLHPQALNLFAGLVRQASVDSQVIVSTQSPALVSEFAPEDVVVAQRVDGASTFTRLDGERLAGWLEDYSLGELWEKNVIEGGPALA